MSLVAEPHPIHGTRLEILGKDVEAWCQVQHELASVACLRSTQMLRLLRLLRRNVAPTERPSGSDMAGSDGPPQLSGQWFDLHDVGTQSGQ